MRLDKDALKETILDVFFFSALYRIAITINSVFLERECFNVISALDTYYPTINMFLVPYFFFYLHIYIAPYFIGYKDKVLLHRYTTNVVISSTIGFIIFLLFPTCVDRRIFEKDLYSFMVYFDRYGNACPSFHVLVTWAIWRNFKQLKISHKLMNAGRILTYSIVASTVFVRQHGIIDIPVAIFIVEVVSFFVDKYNIDSKIFN